MPRIEDSGPDFLRVFRDARELAPGAITELEARLAADPRDLLARVAIFGATWRSEASRAREHAFWIIENASSSPAASVLAPFFIVERQLVPEAISRWDRALSAIAADDPRRGEAYLDAADFALHLDRERHRAWRAIARGLLVDERWGARLDAMEIRDLAGAHDEPPGQRLARVEQLVGQGEEAVHHLDRLAKLAFAAGDADKAQEYAERLLAWAGDVSNSWPSIDDAPLVAHTILGCLALRRGEVDLATKHLSGWLNVGSRRPRRVPLMRLARDLLDHGEHVAVLAFLDACAGIWDQSDRFTRWADDIRAGRTPDFGRYLDH